MWVISHNKDKKSSAFEKKRVQKSLSICKDIIIESSDFKYMSSSCYGRKSHTHKLYYLYNKIGSLTKNMYASSCEWIRYLFLTVQMCFPKANNSGFPLPTNQPPKTTIPHSPPHILPSIKIKNRIKTIKTAQHKTQ